MSTRITVRANEYACEINRSRFIGICRRVADDAEAAAALTEIRGKFRDCTHVCYAYRTGGGTRSSDDGEPSGTAGVPISECIRSAGLSDTLTAVVRYFGGIKLGTGGLVRAYTHAASTVLAEAEKTEVADCGIVRAVFGYAVWKKIEKRSLQSLYKTVGLEYNRAVEVVYAAIDADALIAELSALTQGKCVVAREGVRTVERPYTIAR